MGAENSHRKRHSRHLSIGERLRPLRPPAGPGRAPSIFGKQVRPVVARVLVVSAPWRQSSCRWPSGGTPALLLTPADLGSLSESLDWIGARGVSGSAGKVS